MFQSWRQKLREVEESLKVGRLDDALQILRQGGLLEYLPAKRLSGRLALLYAERAKRRAEGRDFRGGWRDLEAAQSLGDLPACDVARRLLIDAAVTDAQNLVRSGELREAAASLDQLAVHAASNADVQAWRQVVRCLQSATNLAQHGKFGDAQAQLDNALALRPDLVEIRQQRDACHDKLQRSRQLSDELYGRLTEQDWQGALRVADELLELAPQSKLARNAREQAWRRVGARVDSPGAAGAHVANSTERAAIPAGRAASPTEQLANLKDRAKLKDRARLADRGKLTDRAGVEEADVVIAMKPSQPRYALWIDGVGGYLVCLGEQVVLGQHVPGPCADVAILGDLSRRHARIGRSGEGYVIEPIQAVRINGRLVTAVTTLSDGDEMEIGDGVKFRFRRPHALSATARLDPLSRHRTQPHADGVLLMAESCVLGPNWHNHVVCRDWSSDVVLYRHDDELFCRSLAPLEIDGQLCEGRGRLGGNSRVVGSDFSMCLEELDRCSSQPLR